MDIPELKKEGEIKICIKDNSDAEKIIYINESYILNIIPKNNLQKTLQTDLLKGCYTIPVLSSNPTLSIFCEMLLFIFNKTLDVDPPSYRQICMILKEYKFDEFVDILLNNLNNNTFSEILSIYQIDYNVDYVTRYYIKYHLLRKLDTIQKDDYKSMTFDTLIDILSSNYFVDCSYNIELVLYNLVMIWFDTKHLSFLDNNINDDETIDGKSFVDSFVYALTYVRANLLPLSVFNKLITSELFLSIGEALSKNFIFSYRTLLSQNGDSSRGFYSCTFIMLNQYLEEKKSLYLIDNYASGSVCPIKINKIVNGVIFTETLDNYEYFSKHEKIVFEDSKFRFLIKKIEK